MCEEKDILEMRERLKTYHVTKLTFSDGFDILVKMEPEHMMNGLRFRFRRDQRVEVSGDYGAWLLSNNCDGSDKAPTFEWFVRQILAAPARHFEFEKMDFEAINRDMVKLYRVYLEDGGFESFAEKIVVKMEIRRLIDVAEDTGSMALFNWNCYDSLMFDTIFGDAESIPQWTRYHCWVCCLYAAYEFAINHFLFGKKDGKK